MSIVKMRLLHIDFKEERLQDVLLKMLQNDDFHPILASKITSQVSGLHTLQGDNPYSESLYRLVTIAEEMDLPLKPGKAIDLTYDVAQLDTLLDQVETRVKDQVSVRNQLRKINDEYLDSIQYSKYLSEAQFNLDDVFNLKYVKVRFGRLPIDNAPKLEFYSGHPFVYKAFHTDAAYEWCMYFAPLDYEGDVDNVFAALQFERIRIPDFFHGKPDEAIRTIEKEIDLNAKQIKQIEDDIHLVRNEYQKQLVQYYQILDTLNELFVLRKYVIDLGGEYQISGFTDRKMAKVMSKEYAEIAKVTELPPDTDERLIPPTKLKNGWFSKPFEMFVDMYGTPGYHDLDPTIFVAFTYTLLYGIMFADLGQGLVLALLAAIIAKKTKMPLARIGVRVGLSSAFFGTLFGSVFGNEEILKVFFHETLGITFLPFHVFDQSFVMLLLGTTIVIGVILISISISLNITLNIKHKNYYEAMFSHNGIAGLVLYLAVLIGAGGTLLLGLNLVTLPYILILIVLPLLVIFLKEPLTHFLLKKPLFPHGAVDFFTQSFFEMFEVILSFLANTMSFLRVGGFVLAHAGFMLVVYTLAGMVPSAFYLVVIVLGNIFVMGLEGLIVGIQVLRLEFYEMFSRYFEGNGVPFQPIKKQ